MNYARAVNESWDSSSLADESQQCPVPSQRLFVSVTFGASREYFLCALYICLAAKQINRTAFAIKKSTDESSCSLFVMSYTILN